MRRDVCYTLSRNIYQDVVPSLKSVLKNGNIDRVYLITEDDDVGFDLPARVITMKVNPKAYFSPGGPNYNCRWTYMVLMKTVMPYLFPKHKRILTLDVDTIVRKDLSPLWDLDMGDNYFAGAVEPFWTKRHGGIPYVNAGVIMWNLEAYRGKMCDNVIRSLNMTHWQLAEQACLNSLCSGRISAIGPEWNAGEWTRMPPEDEIRIRHYMASHGTWKREQEVEEYSRLSWEEVNR
jgi:lipopolysaccharide biosynthesis glycosyltransferase